MGLFFLIISDFRIKIPLIASEIELGIFTLPICWYNSYQKVIIKTPLLGFGLVRVSGVLTISNYFMIFGIFMVFISSFANSGMLYFSRNLSTSSQYSTLLYHFKKIQHLILPLFILYFASLFHIPTSHLFLMKRLSIFVNILNP